MGLAERRADRGVRRSARTPLGLKVVPYTLNDAAQVKAAAAAGVDALITDDPIMARRALGLPEPALDPPALAPAPSRGAAQPLTLTIVPRSLRTARRRGSVVAEVRGGPATVTLRLSRGGRTIGRRSARVGPRARRIRLPVRAAALAGRRATLHLTGVAATAAGDVVRLRASARLGR